MPKKAARKTKKVTKKVVSKVTKISHAPKATQSFTISQKQDSFLPLLIVVLLASAIFLVIVTRMQAL